MKILLCGCGALGSQIALHLAHPDREFVLVDDDRVEGGNIATSAYGENHIGMLKAGALSAMLWQKCRCKANPFTKTFHLYELSQLQRSIGENTSLLVIDTFDNAESRSETCQLYQWFNDCSIIHAGVSTDRTGEIIWNNAYHLPQEWVPRGENPICTHELGASILRFTAVLCANIVESWMENGMERSVVITSDWRVLG